MVLIQFWSKWMKKIQRQPNWMRQKAGLFDCQRNFVIQLFPGIVLLLINYKAADFRSRYLQVFLHWGAALATHPTHLTMSWCFLVFFFHEMTSLQFKFVFLQHRKSLALIILVSLAKFEKTAIFSQWILKHNVTVVSCHVLLTQYLVLHWLVYSLFCWNWLAGDKLSNFFNNLDTCIVAVVKVSDDTIQLTINWTITIYRQIMTRLSHCILKSIFRKCQSFLKNWQTFLWILARLTRRKKAKNFPCWKKRNMNVKEVMSWKKKTH